MWMALRGGLGSEARKPIAVVTGTERGAGRSPSPTHRGSAAGGGGSAGHDVQNQGSSGTPRGQSGRQRGVGGGGGGGGGGGAGPALVEVGRWLRHMAVMVAVSVVLG